MYGEETYPLTRRTVLQTTGAAAVGVVGFSGLAAASDWTVADTPTGDTLHDVTYTSAGAYAVGGSGIGIERTANGWVTAFSGGPTGNGNNLYGSDVTDDGDVLWFVGASGAIGAYDVSTGTVRDYSAPNDVTNNFNDVAVTGPAGDANVYVAGDSGKVYYSFDNGETFDSVTPGSGSSINAIDFYDTRSGHLVDGNQSAFATDDGTTWAKIGVEDADGNLYGVDSDAADDVSVATGVGTVSRYDGAGWTPEPVGNLELRDVEIDGTAGLTGGDSGRVFERDADGWTELSTPVEENLKAVVRGDPDIAVGAAGTVIERTGGAGGGEDDGGGGNTGTVDRLSRTSTQTAESTSLTFEVANDTDGTVVVDGFAVETDVSVDALSRESPEVQLAADTDGEAASGEGFPVDGQTRPLDSAASYDPGTSGSADFGAYDSGNVKLTVEPADTRPESDYLTVTLRFADETAQRFHFAVTNVNS
nr:hypothetical protein [Halovenus carboxidivorans]